MSNCKPTTPQLKAEHAGVLRIGGAELPCYVLNNGMRVLSQRGMVDALGMSFGDGAERLATFVAQKSLKPFVSNDLAVRSATHIRFTPAGGGPEVHGYEATVLADICTAVLAASASGCLQCQQQHIARQALKLLVDFAKTGIVALVDEATGYQHVRAPDALQSLLDKFIRVEPSNWEQRFFLSDFYLPLYEVCGLERRGGNHPRLFAAITRSLVFRRLLPPGALELLDERNPVDERGGRRVRHHQFLTEEVGVKALREHLAELRGFMRLAQSLDELVWYVDRAFPLMGKTGELPFRTPPVGRQDLGPRHLPGGQ